MFETIVAVEPVNLVPEAKAALRNYGRKVVFYDDLPASEEEMIRRIGDADAALISYTSQMGRRVLEACPHLRYVGMCCSLYDERSANVDIAAARELGVTVRGVRDYGDQGVAEYAVSELVRYLHGFGEKQWKAEPSELTGLRVGVLGMGATGRIVAEALERFGAEIAYFSRRPSGPERFCRRSLEELLPWAEVLFTCLPKNTILLGKEQFERFGNHKILFNTCIGPTFDSAALTWWLSQEDNEFFCDTLGGLGQEAEALLKHPHVNCASKASGTTGQAKIRLGRKVLENMEDFFKNRTAPLPCD